MACGPLPSVPAESGTSPKMGYSVKASDYIVSFIESKGVDVVFGYIGGMITHLVDSIDKNPRVAFVQTYHEQTAAIAAEGYAKDRANFGVAIATSGPGATNLMTGIADAFFDSIPVLFITGQVNTYEYKYDKPIRQQGFQEIPVCEIVRPITKYTTMVDDPTRLKYELTKALHIAMSGRKGPVLLDIPMDVQRTEIDPDAMVDFEPDDETAAADVGWRSEIVELIEGSRRPMVLVGGGCSSPAARALADRFLDASGIPMVTSLMGRGLLDENRPNYLGMIGSYGNRSANMGLARSDLLLVLGSRLDTRQTGAMLSGFMPNGTIVHVDLDPAELESHRLSNRVKVALPVEDFLRGLEAGGPLEFRDYGDWNNALAEIKARYNQTEEVKRFVENKAPYAFMQWLNGLLDEDDVVCVDIGQNQMWAAQTLTLGKGQSFVTSGGLAPMGFALPAAVGCAFSNAERTVYSINGDGGFHMATQSLMLISQYDLPVKVFVFNNHSLGMITQFQHLYFSDRMAGTTADGGYLVPDIGQLAGAYGLEYRRLCRGDLDDPAVRADVQSLRNCVVEMVIDGATTVSPKLEYNQPIDRPSPLLPEEEHGDSLDLFGFSG